MTKLHQDRTLLQAWGLLIPRPIEIDDSVCSDGGNSTSEQNVGSENLALTRRLAVKHSREQVGS